MRKITTWLTATVSALALIVAYQLNVAGAGGKDGDDRPPAPAAVTAPAASSAPPTGSAPAPGDSNKSDSDGPDTDHVGKPGENK
jgi:hypothetical protein